MRKAATLVGLLICSIVAMAETRKINVDFFVLLDVSLSMEGEAIRDARDFTARNIIADLVEPDDWLCLLTFWGDNKIIWQDYIKSQSDKVQLIRQLATIEADGRFTDIGLALDQVSQILEKRGQPERPKYILLITDEIQEARPGTRYYSEEQVLRHHMLDYVRRIDRGLYRVITVGYPYRDSIEESARQLYELLTNPPARPVLPLPGAPPGAPISGNLNPLVQEVPVPAAAGTDSIPAATGENNADNPILNINVFLKLGLPILAGLIVVIIVVGLLRRRPKQKPVARKEDDGNT